MNTPDQELSNLKKGLLMKKEATFLVNVAMQVPFNWNDSIPTARTNGEWIEFSTDFFMKNGPDVRQFVLLHETLHIILNHVDKKYLEGKDPFIANIAQDHVINLMLKTSGIFRDFDSILDNIYIVGEKVQIPCDNKYLDWSWEAVYNDLIEKSQEGSGGGGGEAGDGADSLGYSEGLHDIQPSEKSSEELAKTIDNIILAAAEVSKSSGSNVFIPDSIKTYLNDLYNPKIPTRRLIQRYVNTLVKNDYSWIKRNRRFPDIIMPSNRSYAASGVTFFIDVSGSISDEELETFVNETNSALKSKYVKDINIVQFNGDIIKVDRVKDLREMKKVTFGIGGGTLIEPVFDWIQKNKPPLAFIFTDGYFSMPKKAPKTPIVWCIHGNEGFSTKIGRTIHYG